MFYILFVLNHFFIFFFYFRNVLCIFPLFRKKKQTKSKLNLNSPYLIFQIKFILNSSNPQVEAKPLVIPLPEANPITSIPEKYRSLLKPSSSTTISTNNDSKSSIQIKSENNQNGSSATTTKINNGNHNGSDPMDEDTKQAAAELMNDAKSALEFKDSQSENNGNQLVVPLILRYRNPALDGIADEKKKFDIDVAARPKEVSLDTYEQIPIHEYGHALLRGMGWTPGAAIGLTNAKAIEPIEFVKRPGYRTGLGAKAVTEELPNEKKFIKPGESREVQVRRK